MDHLRVIIVTPEAPDPFGNAAARWYYVLAKGLAMRGHPVVCLSAFSSTPSEQSLQRARESFAAIGVPLQLYPYPTRPWLARKWRTITRPFSFFESDSLRRDLDSLLRKGYEILNLEQMWTGYLGLGTERSLLSVHHLELLDLAGIVKPSIRFLLSKHLMGTAETRIIRRSANIRVTTDRLCSVVSRLNPTASVFTVPVGIDPDLYEFATSDQTTKTVGLVASFGWYPGFNAGVRLLTRIWPRVKKEVPSAKLLIVGWKARKALAGYVQGSDVTIAEDVPEVSHYFRRLSVLAYPLSQGSGMKIKLLEAMAYGTPIVTTSEGAEGLVGSNGDQLTISDEDDGIAEGVVRILSNGGEATRMSRAARALIEQQYSPKPVVLRMEGVYRSMLAGKGKPS